MAEFEIEVPTSFSADEDDHETGEERRYRLLRSRLRGSETRDYEQVRFSGLDARNQAILDDLVESLLARTGGAGHETVV